MLLALAKAEPLKAYEFLAELERLFGPSYRPSPGGVYPALKALAAERLLAIEKDGRAKRYRLTERGREALERRGRQLAALEARTSVDVQSEAALRQSLDRLNDSVLKASGHARIAAVRKVLDRAAAQILELTREGAVDGQNG